MRVLIILTLILIVAVVVLAYRVFDYRRRLAALDQPELMLPRRERREHARKLLRREEEQYQAALHQDLLNLINGAKQ